MAHNPNGTPLDGDSNDGGKDGNLGNFPDEPPRYHPMPPPADVPMVNLFITPGTGVEIDMDLIADFLLPLHLTAHPPHFQAQHFYTSNLSLFNGDYPSLTPFSKALFLAYLRSLHIAQEAMCVQHVKYPTGVTHIDHHCYIEQCVLVRQQRQRIEHALTYQWTIAAGINYWSLTVEEQSLFDSMTTYLYACWNVTRWSYNPESPPRYPLLRKMK
eukprot:5144964-Amphidinium_carterae.1